MNIPPPPSESEIFEISPRLSVIQTPAVKMMHTADRQLHQVKLIPWHAVKLLPGSFVLQQPEIARKKDEKSGRRLQGPL